MDVMLGDPTLFTRNDEVEAQWEVCDPILASWAGGEGPLPKYRAGSQGPATAEELLLPGHTWRAI
jgi:glucose-6-phosphate 1-dehydrogenase